MINTATNTVTATITVGATPAGVAVSPDGTRAYVTNYGSDTVSVIDTATNTVTATITVGSRPEGVAVSPDGTRAYVTNANSDTVSVIDTATNTVTATITVGSQPAGVAVADVPIVPRSLPAVVRLSTSWLLRDSRTSGEPTTTFSLGTRPLVPFTGDWDGDGSQTPGTYSGGVLRLYDEIPPEESPTQITFGDPRGFPVAGDFDGDGRDDVAIYRNATWQIRYADDGATTTVSFGSGSWPQTVPVAGDWDGDGTDGIGTYTPANGTWNLRQTASNGGTPDAGSFVFWTGSGSYPVVGDWDGDGDDTVGVKNATIWSLNNQNDGSAPDITFAYGLANDLPLSWTPSPDSSPSSS